MLMCRGKGCNWRRQCSRYVLGRGVTPNVDVSAEWLDHCLRHESKFVRKQEQDDACISHAEREQTRDEYPKFIAVNSEEGRRVAEQLAGQKEAKNAKYTSHIV